MQGFMLLHLFFSFIKEKNYTMKYGNKYSIKESSNKSANGGDDWNAESSILATITLILFSKSSSVTFVI